MVVPPKKERATRILVALNQVAHPPAPGLAGRRRDLGRDAEKATSCAISSLTRGRKRATLAGYWVGGQRGGMPALRTSSTLEAASKIGAGCTKLKAMYLAHKVHLLVGLAGVSAIRPIILGAADLSNRGLGHPSTGSGKIRRKTAAMPLRANLLKLKWTCRAIPYRQVIRFMV